MECPDDAVKAYYIDGTFGLAGSAGGGVLDIVALATPCQPTRATTRSASSYLGRGNRGEQGLAPASDSVMHARERDRRT